MIVDSSALVAVLKAEDEMEEFTELIGTTPSKLSAAAFLECSIVLGPHLHRRLDEFVREASMQVIPFDNEQAEIARAAHVRYGKKSSSRAQLNFGDCMVYALAKVMDEPLLFKGDDFTHTDITPAR